MSKFSGIMTTENDASLVIAPLDAKDDKGEYLPESVIYDKVCPQEVIEHDLMRQFYLPHSTSTKI